MRTHQESIYRPYVELLGARELPGNMFGLQFDSFVDEVHQLCLCQHGNPAVSTRSLQNMQSAEPLNDKSWLPENIRLIGSSGAEVTSRDFTEIKSANPSSNSVLLDKPSSRDSIGVRRNLDVIASSLARENLSSTAPTLGHTTIPNSHSNTSFFVQARDMSLHDKALFQYLSQRSYNNYSGDKPSNMSFAESSVGEITQDVPINCDNDNGSTITYTIPAVRDFDAGFTDNENDLVLLNTQWVLLQPFPPEALLLPIISRSWTLSQADGSPAQLKMWLDSKKADLAPSSGIGYFPNVYLEGTWPSSDRNDVISIDATRTDVHKGGYIAQYQMKTVKATITPVVDSSTFTGTAPHVLGVGSPPVYNITNGFQAGVNINSVVYLGSYPNPFSGSLKGNPRYIQNVDAINDDLICNGTSYAVRFVDQDKYAHDLNPEQSGPNTNYPFLDRQVQSGDPESDPYYDVPSYANQLTAHSTLPATVNVTMEDGPGLGDNEPIQQINFSTFFSTHLTWSHYDSGEPETTYPLGYFNWYVDFKWIANGTPQGNNSGSWLVVTAGYVPSHAVPNMLRPSIANNAIELVQI